MLTGLVTASMVQAADPDCGKCDMYWLHCHQGAESDRSGCLAQSEADCRSSCAPLTERYANEDATTLLAQCRLQCTKRNTCDDTFDRSNARCRATRFLCLKASGCNVL